MDTKEDIIKQYFESWINKDITIIERYFSEHIRYVECYGPEYNGINQMKQWFDDWNKKNSVLRWDINRFIKKENIIVVEWFFEYEYNKEKSFFDGVSIIEFDESNNKIILVKEFEAKTEHIFPYDKI